MAPCDIEIFAEGRWRPAATVEARGGESREAPTWLEYELDYATERCGAAGHHAVSVRYPVDFTLHDVPTLPAFAIDLLPQGEARRALAARLRARGVDPTDWAHLLHGARNPVGNLRVTSSVTSVEESQEGVTREDVVRRGDGFRDWAEDQGIPMAGSTDTGGAAPKLLLTEDAHGRLHADGALPDHRARRHWIVKFPRGRRRADGLVLANEGPYLEVARSLGLRCQDPATYLDGALFVPRFDRRVVEARVERLGLESVYAALGVVAPGAELDFVAVCAVVAAESAAPHADVIELVLRDALALALGDPDNHGRNTSLLKDLDGSVRLAPLYDFAPMYLDPEGIRRQTRWACERVGEFDWDAIAESLEPIVPRTLLASALRDFGARLAEAPARMREHGVDDLVIDRRRDPTARVARQLAEVEG